MRVSSRSYFLERPYLVSFSPSPDRSYSFRRFNLQTAFGVLPVVHVGDLEVSGTMCTVPTRRHVPVMVFFQHFFTKITYIRRRSKFHTKLQGKYKTCSVQHITQYSVTIESSMCIYFLHVVQLVKRVTRPSKRGRVYILKVSWSEESIRFHPRN